MLDLGKYAGAVMSAWGVTLGLLALLILVTWRQSVKSRRAMEAAQSRRAAKGGKES